MKLCWNCSKTAGLDKLRARYPEGFDAERSLHRKKGDI